MKIQHSGGVGKASTNGNGQVVSPLDEPFATLVSLRKQRYSYRQIGRKLSWSRTTVMKNLRKIVKQAGKKILMVEDPLLTGYEVAEKLCVSPHVITRLCTAGAVAAEQHDNRGPYFIRRSELKHLRKHPSITGKKSCAVCGRIFVYQRGDGSTCSPDCAKLQRRRSYEISLTRPLQEESLLSWHRLLLRELKRWRPVQDERWVTLEIILQMTSLSRTQVWWLHRRKIIKVQDHPTKRWRGRPVVLYPVSVLKIADRTYRSYVKSNGNGHPH